MLSLLNSGRASLAGRTHAIVAANAAVIGAVLLATVAVPAGPFVAVVMPPWSDGQAALSAVARADGALVAPGGRPWIVIAHGRDSGFPSRLRQAGAWLVLNHALLSGCMSNNRTTAQS
jgi:hypothetical protein